MRDKNFGEIIKNIKDESSKERLGKEPLNPEHFEVIRKKPQVRSLPINETLDEVTEKWEKEREDKEAA